MPDASPLLGTWEVISWRRKNIATNEISEVPGLGHDPVGFISYAANGRMFTMAVKRDRPPPLGTPVTGEEKQRLFDTMSAYGGTYTVHADRVVHHVDIAWNQAWVGTDQERFFKVSGEILTLTTAPLKDLDQAGQDSIFIVTWRKMQS